MGQGLCYECFVSHNKLSGGIYGGSNPPSYIKVFKKRNIKKQKTYNRILYLKASSKLQPNYCSHYGKEKSNYILSEALSGKKKIKIVTKASSIEDHNQNLKLNSTTSNLQITNKKAKKYNTNIGNFNDSIDKYLRSFDNKIVLSNITKILLLTKPQLNFIVAYNVLLTKITPFFISKDNIILKMQRQSKTNLL